MLHLGLGGLLGEGRHGLEQCFGQQFRRGVSVGLAAQETELAAQRADHAVEAGLECGRTFDHRQLVARLVGGVEVDRDDQVGMAGYHRYDRQRVEQSAIDQHAVALHHRGEQAGDRRRGAHGLVQAAFLEPDFLLVDQVGGDGRIGDGQVFDIDVAKDLVDLAEHPFAADGAEAEADIQQSQHIEIVEAFHPVAVFAQFARRVEPADHRAHGAAGDAGDLVAAPFDFLDHADVRIAARTAGTEYQRHLFRHADIPRASRFDDTPGRLRRQGRLC
ncbi:hypothetical protein D3C76_1027330 [compost metagenome]